MNDAVRVLLTGLGVVLVVVGVLTIMLRRKAGENLAKAGAASTDDRGASLASLIGTGQILLGLAFSALGLAPPNQVRGGAADSDLATALAGWLPALLAVLSGTALLGCIVGVFLARRAWRSRESWQVGESGAVKIPSRARRDLTLAVVAFALAVAAAVFVLLLIVPRAG